MVKLFAFNADYGRMGFLSGTFLADEDDVFNLTGKKVHFGEALGKHSDITYEVDDDDFSIIDIKQSSIDDLIKALDGEKTLSGLNPFEYLDEEENFEDDITEDFDLDLDGFDDD